MAGYLRKYVGTYRVKAEYDLETNDYPRLENGNLDPSFDDYYIDCKNNIKIKHGTGNILSCYIPSKSRGMNILRQIYKDNISGKLPSEGPKTQKYLENLCETLVAKEILASAEVLDYEVYFEFKATMIDYIATLVGAKTYGASINPMSSKNLPKTKYEIPEEDVKLYKDAIKDLPTKVMKVGDKERVSVDMILLKNLNKDFDKVIIKSQRKGFDINKDKKKKGLKGREYIHSFGSDMWQKYCEFLKNEGGKTTCF